MKKKPQIKGFTLVEGSVGIILDSMWIKDDNSELIIKSAFGGKWHFRPLEHQKERSNEV